MAAASVAAAATQHRALSSPILLPSPLPCMSVSLLSSTLSPSPHSKISRIGSSLLSSPPPTHPVSRILGFHPISHRPRLHRILKKSYPLPPPLPPATLLLQKFHHSPSTGDDNQHRRDMELQRLNHEPRMMLEAEAWSNLNVAGDTSDIMHEPHKHVKVCGLVWQYCCCPCCPCSLQ